MADPEVGEVMSSPGADPTYDDVARHDPRPASELDASVEPGPLPVEPDDTPPGVSEERIAAPFTSEALPPVKGVYTPGDDRPA